MSEKKFIVGPGDEIVIKIPKKITDLREKRKKEISPAKAMLPVRRADEFLPRRKKSGFIEFYDPTYYKPDGGEFENLIFNHTQDEITAADYVELVEMILGHQIESGKNISALIGEFRAEYQTDNYFPFTIAALSGGKVFLPIYNLQPPGSEFFSDRWTLSGLKLNAAELADLIVVADGTGLVRLSGSGRNKITTAPDASAPEADFFPSNKMQIAVVPQIFRFGGSARRINGTTVEDEIFSPYKRYVEFADAKYQKDSPNYRKTIQAGFGGSDAVAYAAGYQTVLRADAYGLETASLLEGLPVPPDFPAPGEPHYQITMLREVAAADALRRVAFIIKQGGTVFYAWNFVE